MNDIYTEQLIKKKKTKKQLVLQGVVLVLTLFSICGALHFPVLFIITGIFIACNIFLYWELDIEYEYLFVNGELDIDKIIHKARRRRICSVELTDVELLTPYGAGELRQYQRAKKSDYSSGTENGQTYVLIAAVKGEQRKIIFEPNEVIINGYKRLDPRKVVDKRD